MNTREEKIAKDFLFDFAEQKESQLHLNWIVPSIILSRKLLKNQKETKFFTSEILGIEFRDYVFRSRPLLLGKILKEIMTMDSSQSMKVLNNLIIFLESINPDKEVISKDKTTSSNYFGEWSRFLNKK